MGFLMPGRCGGCGRAGWRLCPSCIAGLRSSADPRPPPGLDSCASLFAYEGTARQLVARLKFGNERSALPVLGAALASRVAPQVRAGAAVVTWPPTSASRRRRRGYDQAELLARSVGSASGLAARRLLYRQGPDWAQTGQDRSARLIGPSYRTRSRRLRAPTGGGGRHGPDGRVVVIVDDVVTTGATLSAAARALRAAGAAEVHALTLAATP